MPARRALRLLAASAAISLALSAPAPTAAAAFSFAAPGFGRAGRGRRTAPAPAADAADAADAAGAAVPTSAQVEAATLAWVRGTVVGLNLCPFAEPALRIPGAVRTVVVRGDDPQSASRAVEGVMLAHRAGDAGAVGTTTLVVCPELFPDDFERYLSVVQYLEVRVMEAHGLHGDVQIAPFHPLLTYDGARSAAERIGAYTNRSPYPIFHVLRTADVDGAVEGPVCRGDPGRVWRRNARLLSNLREALGWTGAVRVLTGSDPARGSSFVGSLRGAVANLLQLPGLRRRLGPGRANVDDGEVVQEVLRRTKKEMQQEEAEGGAVKDVIRGVWAR